MPIPEPAFGTPCWIDLLTSDPERAQSFYTALFGWTYVAGDQETYGGYITAFRDGEPVAGIMRNESAPDHPDVWTTYLRVEDADATSTAAVDHGGTVLMAPRDVPAQGRMALLRDPSGASVGLWEFGQHRGFRRHGEPGAPFWHELHARNYDDAVAFYRDVFAWNTSVMSDSGDFRYTTLGGGRDAKAGILDATAFLSEGYPAAWQVYFEVGNTDEAVTRALGLGASVTDPAADSPFGRMASLADPTGALFKIAQAPARA